jgi:hypothetical protein
MKQQVQLVAFIKTGLEIGCGYGQPIETNRPPPVDF